MNVSFDDVQYLNRLRQLPNAQLHLHWDGCLPFRFLWDYYQDQGRKLFLPEQDIDGKPVEGDRAIRSLQQLIDFRDGLLTRYTIGDVFDVPIMAMQTSQELKTMAVAACEYLASQNTFYAELRFAPWYHSHHYGRGRSKLSLNDVISSALEGFEQGRHAFGVTVRPIVCINREINPERAKDIVTAAMTFKDDGKGGVVGLDLACYEPPFPPELFVEAFSMAFASSLQRTVHADEMVSRDQGRQNLYTSLSALRADGIGHGIHLHEFPDVMEMMALYNIRLESNPMSVLTTGFVQDVADLHLDRLVEAGVKVTVNADDPAMWSNGDLAHNLYLVGKLYGDKFVETVLRNAIDAAWGMSVSEKQRQQVVLTEKLQAHGFL